MATPVAFPYLVRQRRAVDHQCHPDRHRDLRHVTAGRRSFVEPGIPGLFGVAKLFPW
jgi:hypothetical protein